MDNPFIQITRQEAENIFQNFNVLQTRIKKESGDLKIIIYLSNKKQLQISYNPASMLKSYFIEN